MTTCIDHFKVVPETGSVSFQIQGMQGFPKYMHKTYKYQLAGTNSGA